jgi:hypothetical protein
LVTEKSKVKISTSHIAVEASPLHITPRSGLLLFHELIEALDIKEIIDKHITLKQGNSPYSHSDFALPILLMLLGGGTAIDHLRQLALDAPLFEQFGLPALPATSTVGDWLRRVGDRAKGALEGAFAELTQRLLIEGKHKVLTVDIDATEIISYHRGAEMTYLLNRGYMPLLAFVADSGYCLTGDFRGGATSPAYGHEAFILKCLAAVPPGVKVGYMRSDSAAYQNSVMDTLDAHGVKWSIAVKSYEALRAEFAGYREELWQPFEDGHILDTLQVMSSGRVNRIVVLRTPAKDPKRRGEWHYYAVATSIEESEMDAPTLMQWHRQRATAENFNKEIKNGIGMEHLPCGQFSANEQWFWLCCLAYNIKTVFTNHIAPAQHRRSTIATLRWCFIQVSGYLVNHANRLILKLSAPSWVIDAFRVIRRRIGVFASD